MAPHSSITTHARNTTQHPGLIIVKQDKKRWTKEEVQAEPQAKEDVKQEKACMKAVGIKHVATYEQNQANNDAVEATPKALPLTRQLRCTRSYALIPQYEDVVVDLDSDVDMGNMGTDGSTFNADDGDNDAKTKPVLTLPPRKKVKVTVKAAKPKVQAVVKAAQAEESHHSVDYTRTIPDTQLDNWPNHTSQQSPARIIL